MAVAHPLSEEDTEEAAQPIQLEGIHGLAEDLPLDEAGFFLMYDDPTLGGDSTFYTGDLVTEDGLWMRDPQLAKVLTACELHIALEDCDGGECFRERFVAYKIRTHPPSRFKRMGDD